VGQVSSEEGSFVDPARGEQGSSVDQVGSQHKSSADPVGGEQGSSIDQVNPKRRRRVAPEPISSSYIKKNELLFK